MPRITFELKGSSAFISKMNAAGKAVRREVSKAVYQFGEEVMAESKRIVPVDTGALMNTGKVTLPEESGNTISVIIGYGDESVGYALYVHENLDPNVNWTRPGSGPKYLETPLKAAQDQLPDRVREAIRKAMKGV